MGSATASQRISTDALQTDSCKCDPPFCIECDVAAFTMKIAGEQSSTWTSASTKRPLGAPAVSTSSTTKSTSCRLFSTGLNGCRQYAFACSTHHICKRGPCDKDCQMIHCIPGDMLAVYFCDLTQCIDQGWQAEKDKAKARMAEANDHSGIYSHSIHCERVFQPMQGMERTSICTERSVWGSVRVSVLDTLVHSASGPKPPRAADALCSRHTRSSCMR